MAPETPSKGRKEYLRKRGENVLSDLSNYFTSGSLVNNYFE
jgi:hypothetical protein